MLVETQDEFIRDLQFEKRAGNLKVAVENTSNSRFEEVEASLPEILKNLDQTVMLLGQAFNNISYRGCFNALKQITGDPRKTKQLLKEKKLDIC